jgi:hypothetical protein
MQTMPTPVPIDDRVAALALVRMFDLLREHYYSVDKSQRSPLNDLLPGLLSFLLLSMSIFVCRVCFSSVVVSFYGR